MFPLSFRMSSLLGDLGSTVSLLSSCRCIENHVLSHSKTERDETDKTKPKERMQTYVHFLSSPLERRDHATDPLRGTLSWAYFSREERKGLRTLRKLSLSLPTSSTFSPL